MTKRKQRAFGRTAGQRGYLMRRRGQALGTKVRKDAEKRQRQLARSRGSGSRAGCLTLVLVVLSLAIRR